MHEQKADLWHNEHLEIAIMCVKRAILTTNARSLRRQPCGFSTRVATDVGVVFDANYEKQETLKLIGHSKQT